MKIVKYPFNEESKNHSDKVEILKTWESVFTEPRGTPSTWEHFVQRLEVQGETLSLEKLIDALKKGKFHRTLKVLYSAIVSLGEQ